MRPEVHYEHDWENRFWSGLINQECQWASQITDYNRDVFSQTIESMIVGSIPESQIECLEASYSRGDWSTIPPTAIRNLYEAMMNSVYVGENLDAREPLVQMRNIEVHRQGIVKHPRPVVLPFRIEHLEEFINDLKQATFLTVRRFFKDNAAVIDTLGGDVHAALADELFEVTLPLVFERVKSSVAHNTNMA